MEYEEAIKISKGLKEALSRLESDASSYHSLKGEYTKLTEKEKQTKRALEEANRFQRYYNLLKDISSHCICDQCDGFGGFEYQVGEFEMDSDICQKCNQAGIINKT